MTGNVTRLGVGLVLGSLLSCGLATPILASTTIEVPFSATHAEQQFTVPAGVSTIHAVLVGGHGGTINTGVYGGRGAAVAGDLAVTPGSTLYVEVGGNGQYISGGFNGGGMSFDDGGGGGASDLRTTPRADAGSLASRLMVAAAGGGAGSSASGGDAGSSGDPTPSANTGGSAGTASSGGAGGTVPLGSFSSPGSDGTLGQGGAGGGTGGGGGGAGLFGGGGGADGAGGGGGSSYVGTATNTSVGLDDTGVPSITISYTASLFNVVTATSAGNTSLTVMFDAPPDAAEATTLANYSVSGGLVLSGTPSLSDGTVTITTASQAAQAYIVTVSNVTRAADAAPLTTNSATFTGTGPSSAPPQADVSPASLTFGSVAIGSSSDSQQVTVTNTASVGAGNLHISPLLMTGTNFSDFRLVHDPCSNASLTPGSSCTVLVTFAPSSRGSRAAILRVSDDASGSPQDVTLSGIGVAPGAQVTPSSIDFGMVSVGATSAHQTVTITNTGDAGQTLVLTAATITGPNALDFAFAADHCITTGLLAAGASCTIELTFTPSAAGPRSATLSITDNAAGSPQTVSLTGTGGTPTADLAVSISASPNPVKTGQKVTYTITLYNAGPSTASSLLINDSLSSQSTFVSATISQGQGTCVTPKPGASGVVSCSIASLASGASQPIQIIVTVIAKKSSITNTVTVSAATADPNLANNSASITTRAK